MRGKAEQDPRRARACARNQADRSDNGSEAPALGKMNSLPQAEASRACSFEVSAEPRHQNAPFLTEFHIRLTTTPLTQFSRNR
jgi:hypothetical protein